MNYVVQVPFRRYIQQYVCFQSLCCSVNLPIIAAFRRGEGRGDNRQVYATVVTKCFSWLYIQAAWMLLAELSQFSSSIELKFLLDNWKQHHPSVTMATHTPFVQILVVIGNMARKLSKIAMQDVRG